MGGRNSIIPIPASDVDDWKDRLHWYFASFCRDGSLNPEDLWNDVANERRQLWYLPAKAALLTTVQDDNYQTCVVTHCAGHQMNEWAHLFGYIEDWARGIGCQRIEAIARPGWERILDMKKTHVVLEKRL